MDYEHHYLGALKADHPQASKEPKKYFQGLYKNKIEKVNDCGDEWQLYSHEAFVPKDA